MLLPLALSLVAAVIPTILYVYLIWWCDRYEREPGWLMAVAFIWGAIPAIVLAVLGAVVLNLPFGPEQIGQPQNLVQLVLVAPFVEELAKGLALVLLFVFMRNEIDGVLDGIIYGALVGAGFAMTENFLYFVDVATTQSSSAWLLVAFLRAIIFGLNQAFYTSITGIAVGYAAQMTNRMRQWLTVLAGLTGAIILHSFHNLATYLATSTPPMLMVSALLNWGGIFILVAVIALAIKQEQLWISDELAEEVPENLSQDHFDLVQMRAGRRAQLSQLLFPRRRSRLSTLELQLYKTATTLAFLKHRSHKPATHTRAGTEGEIGDLRQDLALLDARLTEASLSSGAP